MKPRNSTRGTVAATTFAPDLNALPTPVLLERYREAEGTRLNPTVPEPLRRQARQLASCLWLAAFARGVQV